ncbi:cytoplasmic dynein 1 light intermediate chain 1, partial [Striga asiatica]
MDGWFLQLLKTCNTCKILLTIMPLIDYTSGVQKRESNADNVFVDLLIESHVLGKWNNGRPGRAVFDYCRSVFIGELELIYSHDEFDERFDFIQKQYQVFSWMLGKPGLHQCIQSNILTAPVAVWDDVFEADLCFMFEEVCSTNPRSEVVLDRNATKLFLLSLLHEQMWFLTIPITMLCKRFVVATTLLPNMVRRTTPLVKAPSTRMPMAGSRAPLRIPRPPHKPDPSSCKGSTSDPH